MIAHWTAAFALSALSTTAAAARLEDLLVLPLQYKPVEIHASSGRLLEEPRVYEHVRLTTWDYSEGVQAETMDVVAVFENVSEEASDKGRVALQMSRRVTELQNALAAEPTGTWTPWQDVESADIGPMTPRMVEKVTFERVDLTALWMDLWRANQWPTQIRFRVVATCANCETLRASRSEATVRFVPGD